MAIAAQLATQSTIKTKAFDRKGLVLHCSSYSKTLAPSYRAGWCAPGKFLEQVSYLKYVTNLSSPSLLQLAVADFLANGGYDHHLRRIRRAYAERALPKLHASELWQSLD